MPEKTVISRSTWRLSASGDVGSVLAGVRREAGLTQEEAAQWAGLRRQYISDLESNPGSLQVRRLVDLLTVLGYELVVVPTGADVSPHSRAR